MIALRIEPEDRITQFMLVEVLPRVAFKGLDKHRSPHLARSLDVRTEFCTMAIINRQIRFVSLGLFQRSGSWACFPRCC